MIRNTVLGRLRVGTDGSPTAADRSRVEAGLTGILSLDRPDLLDNQAGWDRSLREGGWDFAITNDWPDAESYGKYDEDGEHNRYRQMIVGACEQVARVQCEIADAADQ